MAFLLWKRKPIWVEQRNPNPLCKQIIQPKGGKSESKTKHVINLQNLYKMHGLIETHYGHKSSI